MPLYSPISEIKDDQYKFYNSDESIDTLQVDPEDEAIIMKSSAGRGYKIFVQHHLIAVLIHTILLGCNVAVFLAVRGTSVTGCQYSAYGPDLGYSGYLDTILPFKVTYRDLQVQLNMPFPMNYNSGIKAIYISVMEASTQIVFTKSSVPNLKSQRKDGMKLYNVSIIDQSLAIHTKKKILN